MKTRTRPGIRNLIIAATLAALPQIVLAHGPAEPSFHCPPEPSPPHGLIGAPGTAGMPLDGTGEPPWLRGIDLSEKQRDALFDLMHAQQPVQRTLEKKALRALDGLRRLAATDSFDVKAARALANDYAQAVGELTFNRAQADAQLRALLTAEQRQRVDAPPAGGPRPPSGSRDGAR